MNARTCAFAALALASAAIASAGDDPPAARDAGSAQAPSVGFAFPPLATLPKLNDAAYAEMIKGHGSDLLVVNFWATWCGPCVEELPHFAAVSRMNPPERVRFVGLSLDMDNQVESKVIPFLKEKAIPYPNFLLDPEDADKFISSVSEEWSGAIPATMFYDRQGRKVGELLEPVTQQELEAALGKALAKAKAPGSITTTTTSHADADGSVTTTATTTKAGGEGSTTSSPSSTPGRETP